MGALRDLRRSPAYAASAMGLLSLGFGAAFAIGSVFIAVLLRPLPFPEPDRLVALTETYPAANVVDAGVSAANAADWMNQATRFSGIGAYEPVQTGLAIIGAYGSSSIRAANVTATLFETLGVRPVVGRTFGGGYEPGVVISHRTWLRHFDARMDIVGATIELAPWGRRVVYGVMPEYFSYPAGTDIWFLTQVLSRRADGTWRGGGQPREDRNWSVVARLSPGATVEAATAELRQIAGRLAVEHPASNTGWSATVVGLQAAVTAPVRSLLVAVAVACVLLLVMTTTNSLNLALVRGWLRRADMEVRTALGATPAQLFGAVLTERVVIATGGAVGGVLVGAWLLGVLRTGAASIVPRVMEVQIDPMVVVAVFGTAVLLALVEAGLLVRARGGGWDGAVSRGATSTVWNMRSGWLIGLQVAVSIVLLLVAAVAVLTVERFRNADRGYTPANLTVLQLVESPATPSGAPELARLARSAMLGSYVSAANSLPRVVRAALISDAPFNGETWSRPAVSRALTFAPAVTAGYSVVSETFMDVVGATVIEGRNFDSRDVFSLAELQADPAPLAAAIVNRTLAQRVFGRGDPVGETLYSDGRPRWTVVGVIADIQLHPGTPVGPELFVSLGQQASPLHQTMIVRTSPGHGPSVMPESSVRTLREAVTGATIFNVRSATEIVDATIPAERVASALMRIFAVVSFAVSLSGLGLVVSLVARSSRRSIAIRRVLGAQTRDVALLVCRGAFRALGVGVAVGIGLSLVVGRLLVTQGYWSEIPGPGLLAATAVVFIVASGVALFVPTQSAARIEPVEALKADVL